MFSNRITKVSFIPTNANERLPTGLRFEHTFLSRSPQNHNSPLHLPISPRSQYFLTLELSAKTYLIAGIILSLLTAILIPISIFVPVYIQSKFSQAIYYNVLITEKASNDPDHQVYKAWTDSTSKAGTATTLEAYMYNITNAQDVLQGAKPILAETGPYSYTIVKKKDQISFDTDIYGEKIVRYVEFKTFVFDPKKTPRNLSPTDQFTNVNLIFQLWRSLVSNPISSLIYKEADLLKRFGPEQNYDDAKYTDFERQYITKTVDEWLFGWNDKRFDADKSYQNFFPGLLGPNRTDSSEADLGHAMYTGETRLGNAFTYYQHNGPYTYNRNERNPLNPNDPLWNSDYFASRFSGTDGTRFYPHVNKSAELFVYVDEARRSVPMEYTDEYEIEGLKLLNYEISRKALENSTTNPTNALWNIHTTAIFNLSQIKMMPMIITKPHFLDCDDSMKQGVVGLNPVYELHETRLGIHQISGIVMNASKSLQVAVDTRGPLEIKSLNETWFPTLTPNTYTPIGWFSEKGRIRDKDAKNLAAKISSVDTWVSLLTIGSTIVCITMLILSFASLIFAYKAKIKNIQVFNSGGAYGDYDLIN